VALETSGAFSGRHPENAVDRITKLGNGVQVEQPEAVRQGARRRRRCSRLCLPPARGRAGRILAAARAGASP
jgi:hypothetical protein